MASELNRASDPGLFWKRVKVFKNKWTNTSPNAPPTPTSEYLNQIEKLSPPWVLCTLQPNTRTTNTFLDAGFTLQELNTGLNKTNQKSAPGPDYIEYQMLKLLPIAWKLTLLDILNEMYDNNLFPEEWHTSKVLLIPKPNQKGFRPISLTSCMCKLMESMHNVNIS
ncbi:hypothetical protein ANTQUA_LOCUS3615 [Anthophora quadrimaculata]